MNQDRQELRSAAERDFLESLDQLQKTLSTGEIPMTKSTTASDRGRTGDRQKTVPPPIDETEIEAAAADIEEFINSHYPDLGSRAADD